MALIIDKEKFKKYSDDFIEEKKYTILIVDDEPSNNEAISAVLKNEYNIIQSCSGEEALELLQDEYLAKKINVIISDQRMPKMKGVEFLKQTIPMAAKAIRIILTGYIDIKDIIDAINDGHIYNFLIKPLEPSELIIAVKRALEVYDMELQNEKLIEKMKEINETLEHKIKERTADLERTNKELSEKNIKLKELQIQIIQREKLASVGQLAAGVAHELNNPMGFISGNYSTLKHYVEVIKMYVEVTKGKCCEDTDMNEFCSNNKMEFIIKDLSDLILESEEGIDRVVKIVKTLKDFSRLESNEDNYDLNKGVEDTLIIAKNEYKYFADVKTELGEIPIIKVNGGEINEVLLNIIVNAAQAIAGMNYSEKKLIIIRTYEKDKNLYCEIEDNGPGIPDNIKEKIFDPFFTTKEPGKGTGLGLNITYNIIKKHNGKILVESQEGVGTKFIIVLPYE